MKPIPAIVEPAVVDLDLAAEQIIVASAGLREADTSAARLQQQADSARAAATARRMEIGRILCRVRPTWPERGPKAKGWGEFLARVKIDDATAYRYMDEYRNPQDFAQKQRALSERTKPAENDDEDEPERVHGQPVDPPPFRQQTKADLIQALGRLSPEDRKDVLKVMRANVKGGSGETDRGTWCTAKDWAEAVGAWDLDPFSNPRSHILSAARCMLEDGGDAFGGELGPSRAPGSYLTGNAHGATPAYRRADELTRVWIQPPYELVAAAIAHYGHTRFCALLRWSPDVKAWFPDLWKRTAVVAHPWCERMEFEPPPGVDKSGDMPFPHALYYAHEADVTDEVRRRCIVWRINHDIDDAQPIQAALHIVR